MKYDIEVLVPGTELHHDLTLRTGHTDIEAACLGHAFELFNERPVLGGMASRGLGKVDFEYDELPSGEPYREWVDENREGILGFIENLEDRVA
jgi:CRISPR/Cas system CSM-associated protein Csm3 (group 7 of RAMP superfamily)